eukprot:scaffold142509_cov30-Tisochrysis_lutea.AAC.2
MSRLPFAFDARTRCHSTAAHADDVGEKRNYGAVEIPHPWIGACCDFHQSLNMSDWQPCANGAICGRFRLRAKKVMEEASPQNSSSARSLPNRSINIRTHLATRSTCSNPQPFNVSDERGRSVL